MLVEWVAGKNQVTEKCMSCLNSLWGAGAFSFFCACDLCTCALVRLCCCNLCLPCICTYYSATYFYSRHLLPGIIPPALVVEVAEKKENFFLCLCLCFVGTDALCLWLWCTGALYF